MQDFGLYLVVTDPVAGYVKCAEAAVRAGVKVVQLRMKHASRDELLGVAREMRSVTAGTDTLFIVDDDASVAAESGADGVHVGQSDMSPADVRRLFPALRIIGLSTHNLRQAEASRDEPIDYIGVGPVYATPTKAIPDPTLGPALAGQMIAAANVPAVAIGGIDAGNIAEVIAVGARNFAVVRAVCRSESPYDAIRRLQDAANAARA